jgi:predicted MFS family arabinose efflux permease
VNVRRPSPYLIVFTLWLLVFSSASQTMIIAPILPLIGGTLGIPDSMLGTLVSAYALMVGVMAIVSGPISDKVGRRRILLLGAGGMTVALVLHAFVTGYVSFMAVRVLAGMAGGVLSGAAVSYIGDFFPYERRGWATGWVMSGSAVGQIIGIPVGITISARWGFRAPFYLFAATMAATVVLLFLRIPQPPVKRTEGRLSIRRAAAGYLSMLKRSEVVWAAAAYFTMFFGRAVYLVYLPTWLERDLGATPGQIATMYLLGGFADVATGPQAGRLSDRYGRRGILLLASVGLSVVMLATPFVVRRAAWAYPLFFVTMVLVSMRVSPFSALLTSLVDDERRGSLMSLTVALGQVGFAVGSAIAGPLFARAGYTSNAVVGAVFVLALGVIVWSRIPEPRFATTTGAPPPPAARSVENVD